MSDTQNSIYKTKKNGFIPFNLDIGGAKGDRTPDLIAASDALSQLSYGPIFFQLRN
jgi:hypothetical protein